MLFNKKFLTGSRIRIFGDLGLSQNTNTLHGIENKCELNFDFM